MRNTFHLKNLAVAIATLSVASVTNAAGLDRSGQDVTAFFQDGTYAEAVYTYIDADVSGYDSANVNPGQNDYERGNKTGDIAESYDFFRYGVKTDINDTFSVGVLYDEPFGAAAEYTQSNFVASEDRNASGGALVGDETKLRGLAYGPATGYTSNSNPDMDYGYIAGIAYSKPEIALKAALTYRSEIDHDIDISENYPIAGILAQGAALQQGATPAQAAAIGAAAANRNSNYEITTPKSVNFDFQTGINPTTLATAKVRWVPWSDFVITPPLYNDVSKRNYGPDGLDLVEYEDDQWQVELGLAKRVAPALAISGTVGWDSGAGDPTTSLGPVDGYYSVGLGAKYNVTENWAVSAGGKYLWFGDAKGRLPSGKIVGDFQDNDGYIAGLKISYQGK